MTRTVDLIKPGDTVAVLATVVNTYPAREPGTINVKLDLGKRGLDWGLALRSSDIGDNLTVRDGLLVRPAVRGVEDLIAIYRIAIRDLDREIDRLPMHLVKAGLVGKREMLSAVVSDLKGLL